MFGPKSDHHEFKPLLVEIEEEPLNPLGRRSFWVIIMALTFFSLWMILGKIDIVVTARGKVVPAGEVKTIQPLTTGVVRRILVHSGQLVEAGEVLMEIDPSETEPELASMKADLQQVELERLRLQALLNGRPFAPSPDRFDSQNLQVQDHLYRSSRERLARQILVKEEELAQTGQRLAAGQKESDQAAILLEASRQRLARLDPVRDLIRQDEYDQVHTDVAIHGNQFLASRHRVEELQFTLNQIRQQILLIREETREELLADLARKDQEFRNLQAKVGRIEFLNARQQIRAPVRGYVDSLLVHTIGGVVTPAEKLAFLVPADSPPVIKAQVLNRDVGYLAPGMEVAIKVDTFEFQRYGMLRGKLLQVSRDSMEDQQLGLVYEAYVEPLQKTLRVEGVETPITTGMSVTAEIKVGKRRIIEFFIYPLVRYLDEGTSVR